MPEGRGRREDGREEDPYILCAENAINAMWAHVVREGLEEALSNADDSADCL